MGALAGFIFLIAMGCGAGAIGAHAHESGKARANNKDFIGYDFEKESECKIQAREYRDRDGYYDRTLIERRIGYDYGITMYSFLHRISEEIITYWLMKREGYTYIFRDDWFDQIDPDAYLTPEFIKRSEEKHDKTKDKDMSQVRLQMLMNGIEYNDKTNVGEKEDL